MVWTLVAISGMLAAAPAEPPPAAEPAAVEISFATHAGEGATGRKRFMRDGCYQIESGGGTGGAGYARDSQAGCRRSTDVAPVFTRLGAIRGDALVRETAVGGGGARDAPARGLMPGRAQTEVVLVRRDGSRWVAANQATADELVRAIGDLPSENQWYAKPPERLIGKGGQLLVLSVATSGHGGSRRLEASLASDGRWWCYRSVIGQRGGEEQKLPPNKVLLLPASGASARLARILAGARPDVRDEPQAVADKRSDKNEISVEVVWPGQARGPLRPARLADAVAERFAAEMQALSPACAIGSEPKR